MNNRDNMNSDNRNTMNTDNTPNDADSESPTHWWDSMLTRREANMRLAKLGAMAALIAASGVVQGCGDDDDEVEQEALDLQKKEGWNVGSTDKSLTVSDRMSADSSGSITWQTYLNPDELLKAYAPKNSSWSPFVVNTLVQSLSQSSLKSSIAPICSAAMKDAYSRGLGMKELLKRSQHPEQVALMVDMKGAEAVAFAAAMADYADTVITFDNWPHPIGVVPSQDTLGAMVYYAQEVSQKKEKRKDDKSPAVFLLDSNRLNPASDPDTQFDNRYVAKVPSPDKLESIGIKTVMYVSPDSTRTNELDDLNDDFAAYQEKGIPVSMLAATEFKPPQPPPPDAKPEEIAKQKAPLTENNTTIYHYGGNPFFMPWFWWAYPMFLPSPFYYPSYSVGYYGRYVPSGISRPTYQPARRPTSFSSRVTGGASGVGRLKPSGFGRVSTRVSGTGSTTGIRAGRSGSFSRSRGGGFWS
jgi:hypothetical protein